MRYRYRLEKYNRQNRYTCPQCGRYHCFTRYIDTDDGEYIADDVGKCDHEDSCGYHKTPREYFAEQREHKPKVIDETAAKRYREQLAQEQERERQRWVNPDTIDMSIIERQRELVPRCPLFTKLADLLGEERTNAVLAKYHVGATLDGRAMWPQIDTQGRCRTAKVMAYKPDGHRVKTDAGDRVSWLHSMIDARNRKRGIKSKLNFAQCWFGSHLVTPETKEINVVESEKTAVICSAIVPNSVWLATGGVTYLQQRYAPAGIEHIKMNLWTDIGAAEQWRQAANNIHCAGVNVVTWYNWEGAAVTKKADVADYLLLTLTAATTTTDTDTTITVPATTTTTTTPATPAAATQSITATVAAKAVSCFVKDTIRPFDIVQPAAVEDMPFPPTMPAKQWQVLTKLGLAF